MGAAEAGTLFLRNPGTGGFHHRNNVLQSVKGLRWRLVALCPQSVNIETRNNLFFSFSRCTTAMPCSVEGVF